MLSLLASLTLLHIQDQPPRLRTVLDNGAIILVESKPREPVVSVQLFASSKYVPEMEASHGYRHLLEHLVAKGDGTLDSKLESQACFLTASTLRDSMQIDLTVGPSQIQVALETLGGLLRKPVITQDQISHEMRVMRDELSMQDDSFLLSSAAWSAAFGETGLDPLGTFDSMYRATPERLGDIFDRQFAADGLALVIAGPVDIDKITDLAKPLLAPLAKGHFDLPKIVRQGKAGRAQADAFGECRAAIVPGFDSPQTMAALAAALAMASELPDCFVTYTPSVQTGLVLVGHTDSTSGVGLYIDGLDSGSGLFARGKQLAMEWVERQLRTASGAAYLRGLLLCQGLACRPESMLDQIRSLSAKQFDEGIRAFSSTRAVTAVGTR